MFPQEEALIRRVYDNRIVGKTILVEVVQYAAYVVVYGRNAPEISLHVFLVLCLAPGNGVLDVTSFSFVQRVTRARGAYCLGALPYCRGAGRVVVEQRGRFGDIRVGEHGGVLVIALPHVVGRLVMTQDAKWSVPGPVLERIKGQVGDDVGNVSLYPGLDAVVDELGIVVSPLSRQDVPVVKAGRLTAEVPLPDHGRVVSGIPEHLRKGDVVGRRCIECDHPVGMRVHTGQYGCPAWRADGIGAETVVQTHALCRDPVQIRCGIPVTAVATHGVGGVIVRHISI